MWRSRPRSPPTGLSPRVRGNQSGLGGGAGEVGSIPASAGEPGGGGACRSGPRVYPRECGGTERGPPGEVKRRGLSPRVRGNPGEPPVRVVCQRSIPASAGEPPRRRAGERGPRVYPRECGGTVSGLAGRESHPGLSPRVRGNQLDAATTPEILGSIPASAGEPNSHDVRPGLPQVYPRECGGTKMARSAPSRNGGLSPRVRGNRDLARAGVIRSRSIPASAGEPNSSIYQPLPQTVYPRECGGTVSSASRTCPGMGLSPRVRGNLQGLRHEGLGPGSIPASAGEPPHHR